MNKINYDMFPKEVWNWIVGDYVEQQNEVSHKHGYLVDIIYEINQELIDDIKEKFNFDINPELIGFWMANQVYGSYNEGLDDIEELFRVEKATKTVSYWKNVK